MTNKFSIWLVFYLCTVVASSAGFVFPLGDENPWYATLVDPSFAPPSWVFGPVWTTLYLLIATSAYRLTQTLQHSVHPLLPLAMALWALQLALNVIWTPVFAGAQDLGMAFVYIIALWASILSYIVISWRVDTWASLMMVPYFAWVSFASLLNYNYWMLNA